LPVFRELWGWAAFAVLATAALAIVVATTEWNGFGDFVIAVGRKVEPLWVSLAILVYTVIEGVAMLANAFKKKLRDKYRAEGRAETLATLKEAAQRKDASLEDVKRAMDDETRRIVQNERG
jgi:hypothetical protein